MGFSIKAMSREVLPISLGGGGGTKFEGISSPPAADAVAPPLLAGGALVASPLDEDMVDD